MIKLKTLIAYVIIFHSSYAQNSYYDALKIRNSLINISGSSFTFKADPTSLHEVSNLLKNYLVDVERNDSTFTEAQVFTRYSTNALIGTQASSAIGGASASPAGFVSFLSKAGNLDITNLADGFAKFLVARTKEELNVAFFEKFKKKLDDPAYADAVTLFPQTASTFSAIGDQIYNYESYINALREAFEADLNSLLSNLPKVLNSQRYNKDIGNPAATDLFFDLHSQLKSIGLSAAYIGNGLLNKVEPGQIIADFDVTNLDGFATRGNNDVKATMQTLQLFSESLRSKGTDHYWIDALIIIG